MRQLSFGQPLGSDDFQRWAEECIHEIERASLEYSGEGSAAVTAAAGDANPLVDGVAAPGTATSWSREDHVHPTNTLLATTAYVTSVIREVLTAARTYYVRSDGSDANSGLGNTSGGAFLTIAKAFDVAAALDCRIFQLTIQIAAGTWAVPVVLPITLGSLPPVLTGVGATTIVSTTSANAVTSSGATPWILQSMKLQTTTGGHCLDVSGGALVTLSTGIEFGACAGFHLFARGTSTINCLSAYTISGGAQLHYASNGLIFVSAVTVTVTGTPAFSVAFALASSVGYLSAFGITYSGAATGQRYLAQLNGVIFTNGGGANYFPGNAPGATATGGQYA